MRVVVDEGVPRDLVRLLRQGGHDVHSFPKAWKGTKNGRLLLLLKENEFECLITTDKKLVRQQNLNNVSVVIVVLASQDLEVLKRNVERISDILRNVRGPGVYHATFDDQT